PSSTPPPDLIGFHGQTILHRPQDKLTLQIGRADQLALKMRLPVVSDFRHADVRAGGQGAPLVPIFHHAMGVMSGLPFPLAFVNIGGIANLTYLSGPEDNPLACDTGPGNALINDVMWHRAQKPMDEHGRVAQRGRVHQDKVQEALQHPYFSRVPPKSLDRHDFSPAFVDDLSLEDAIATLTAFSADAIVAALRPLPSPTHVIVCGGGAHNLTLMQHLSERLPCPLLPTQDLGFSGDALEAYAFAYLAVRTV